MEIHKKTALYDQEKGSVKTWIMLYAYHRSFNRRKYLALRGFYDTSVSMRPADVRLSYKPNQLEYVNSHEWQEILRQALQGLSLRERRVIEMIMFDGLTAREASSQMQESYANVRNLYYRGLKKLKQILERDFVRP
jgi:RNA polymerase sigma-70 factor, ECF subfamily